MKLGRNVAWMLGLGVVLVGVSAEAAKAPKAAAKATGGFRTKIGVVIPGAVKSIGGGEAVALSTLSAFSGAMGGVSCKPIDGEGSKTQLLHVPDGQDNGKDAETLHALYLALSGSADVNKPSGQRWASQPAKSLPLDQDAWTLSRTIYAVDGTAPTTYTYHVWTYPTNTDHRVVLICDPAMAAAPVAAPAPAPAPAPAAKAAAAKPPAADKTKSDKKAK